MDEIEVGLLGPGDAGVPARVAEGVLDAAPTPERAEAFLAAPGHLIAVARAGRVVVGMAHGVATPRSDKPPGLFVAEVGTADDRLRRGVATRCVLALIAEGRARGCRTAWAATDKGNAPAPALLRSLGADETEGIVTYGWGEGTPMPG